MANPPPKKKDNMTNNELHRKLKIELHEPPWVNYGEAELAAVYGPLVAPFALMVIVTNTIWYGNRVESQYM